MFKILGGSYGAKPATALLAGQLTIACTADQAIHKLTKSLGTIYDNLDLNRDVQEVQLVREEDLGRKKGKGALLALGGAALVGPLGIAAYFMGGKREECVAIIKTRMGAEILVVMDKQLFSHMERSAMAAEMNMDSDKTFVEPVDPRIKEAITKAADQNLCNINEVDASNCRISLLGEAKVVLVSKKGTKLALVDVAN